MKSLAFYFRYINNSKTLVLIAQSGLKISELICASVSSRAKILTRELNSVTNYLFRVLSALS